MHKNTINAVRKTGSKLRDFSLIAISALAVNSMASAGAGAETLNQALVKTYIKNPTLNAQRAQLRATDEGVALANSGFRPVIIGNADASYQRTDSNPAAATDGKLRPHGYSVTLQQTLFRGLRVINSRRQAESEVLAAREDLRGVEQRVFLDTVTAYMDVVRDRAIVRLRENNVKVLTKQLRATQDRKDVGEVTITDVAQAKARRSGAVSQLSLARANLASSSATYQRLIGNQPARLRSPGSLRKFLPRSLSVAKNVAASDNPTILAATYREQSAKHAINIVRGELLPEATASTTYSRRFNNQVSGLETETTVVTGTLNVPLYQAGSVSARIRQSKQTLIQRKQQVRETEMQVKADVIAAWGRLEAARAQLTSDRTQVSANRTALNGVRAQERQGEQTVLEVLNAEQELLDSQVALSTTKRDLVVAGYAVLSAIGRLSASDLGLRAPIYDKSRYYDKVRGKWFGFGKRVSE